MQHSAASGGLRAWSLLSIFKRKQGPKMLFMAFFFLSGCCSNFRRVLEEQASLCTTQKTSSLSATRPKVVLGMRWSEISLQKVQSFWRHERRIRFYDDKIVQRQFFSGGFMPQFNRWNPLIDRWRNAAWNWSLCLWPPGKAFKDAFPTSTPFGKSKYLKSK